MGFFTSHVLQRVFSGLGRIWQPLVMGHQPDLTAARRCYFDGAGNDATTTNSLTQPKKAFRRILLSSFPSSWTEFTPSSYPLYSATTDGPAIRHNHLYDDAMPRPRFSLPGAGWSGGGGVERAWGEGRAVLQRSRPSLCSLAGFVDPHGSHGTETKSRHSSARVLLASSSITSSGHAFSQPPHPGISLSPQASGLTLRSGSCRP